MEPLSRLLDASRLNVCIAITNESRRTITRLTCHILLSCLLYQLEFPTLLAMREIIASAFISPDFSPNRRQSYKLILESRYVGAKIYKKTARHQRMSCSRSVAMGLTCAMISRQREREMWMPTPTAMRSLSVGRPLPLADVACSPSVRSLVRS